MWRERERCYGIYMVRQPEHFLKTVETARPISFQHMKFIASYLLILLAPFWFPKSLITQLTKSSGVTPPLLWAFIIVTKVLIMSKNPTASATCCFGLWTENLNIAMHKFSFLYKKRSINLYLKYQLDKYLLNRNNSDDILQTKAR